MYEQITALSNEDSETPLLLQSGAVVARLAHNQKVDVCNSVLCNQFMNLPDKCECCGACCVNKKDSKWIEVTLLDSLRLPSLDFIQEGDVEIYAMKQTSEGKCVCLDKNNRCTIYEVRPTICRTVQKGDKFCLDSLAAIV